MCCAVCRALRAPTRADARRGQPNCIYRTGRRVRVLRRRSCTGGLFSFPRDTHAQRHATHTPQRTVASHEQRHRSRRHTPHRRACGANQLGEGTPMSPQSGAEPAAQKGARAKGWQRLGWQHLQRRAAADATVEPAAQISWGRAHRCRRKWAEPAAQKGARAKGWRCRGACGTAERTACGANHHGGQVTGIGHTLSRRRRRRRRRPGNSSTCWWCGCHPVSAARGQSTDRTRVAARHDHGSLRAHGTRPLAACVGIGACLLACLQHLVGEPRTWLRTPAERLGLAIRQEDEGRAAVG